MKIAIESLIHEMEGRLSGYVTLLVYRYANLCIKAQPMALLSAQIIDEEMGEMTIEQVAGVTIPDEFHMKKSVIEEEITLCGLARWLGIETTDNTGIGIVPLT